MRRSAYSGQNRNVTRTLARPARWAVLVCACAGPLLAQSTLHEAVDLAAKNDPSIQIAQQQAEAASAGVRLARTAFLPQADMLMQVNRATRNNIFGMLLPQSVIPSISGPPLAANAGTNVWGSAVGTLVNWEPFDFGLRGARVRSAAAAESLERKAIDRARYEVKVAAADAFFSVLAADQLVRSAEAGVERARSLETVTSALSNAQLKPGADAARATAERAAAEAQLIRAQQVARDCRVALVRLTGTTVAQIKPDLGAWLQPAADAAAASQARHPALLEQESAVQAAEAKRHELDYEWRPRFALQSALYARGTGALANGLTEGGANGLGPNIYNWGVGFTVTFPLLAQPSLKARQSASSANEVAEQARLKKVERDLAESRDKAASALEAAIQLARTTPVQLDAAKAAYSQATARYQSGLTGVVEPAEAQRLLLQAEIDDALAKLSVWRARLAVASAAGDLDGFLAQVEK